MREQEGITKGHQETLRVLDKFIILLGVMVSVVYTYVRTHQMVYFVCGHSFYVNYTLINL